MNPSLFALPTGSVGPEKVELCAAFLSGEQWNYQPAQADYTTFHFILFPLDPTCLRIRDPSAFHSKQQT